MKRIVNAFHFALFAFLFCVFVADGFSQPHFFGGVKYWYADWDLRLTTFNSQMEPSELRSASHASVYITARFDDWAATVSYGKTLKDFTQQDSDFQLEFFGEGNARFALSREDINALINYYVLPELTFFVNLKLLNYRQKSALTFYTDGKDQVLANDLSTSGVGIGGGAQIIVPFGDDMPFWSFINAGGVYNSFTTESASFDGTPEPDSKLTEVLYFLDAGMGFWIEPGKWAVTFGIRMERGEETSTFVGPLASLLVTF